MVLRVEIYHQQFQGTICVKWIKMVFEYSGTKNGGFPVPYKIVFGGGDSTNGPPSGSYQRAIRDSRFFGVREKWVLLVRISPF